MPKRNGGKTITCAMKDAIYQSHYNVVWAVPCDGVIECSDRIDESGCKSKIWLLPLILIGSGISIYFTLVCYLHFKLKKSIGELLQSIQEENQQSVSPRTKKLMYVASLTEQEDSRKIQILVNNEVEIHGSYGKAICCLKVITT